MLSEIISFSCLFIIKSNSVNLFGSTFVENNKNNCLIKIKGEDKELISHYEKETNNEKEIEIKLIIKSDLINMEGMLCDCSSLFYISEDFSLLNTSKCIDMNTMFFNCILLKSLPDISKWNTSNVIDMSYLFGRCESLETIPDISNWDTSKVEKMHHMFYQCVKLLYLPDLSKWDTSKVIRIDNMFFECFSLLVLPC